jgi:hypothetical protein
MRTADDMAAEAGRLVRNHGGSGDDVETAHPGHVVSVLTPTSCYMQPFLSHLAASADPTAELRIAHRKGRFGRQVASGAEAYAWQLGFSHLSTGPAAAILADELPEDWVLYYGRDLRRRHRDGHACPLPGPSPAVTCTVAAGVREFREAVESPHGTFGIAQWSPESGQPALLASEREFLDAYHATAGELPGYPAAQAAATAVLAVHCARQAGRTDRELPWPAVAALDTSTLFGAFKNDQATGAQVSHRTVLIRWADEEPIAIQTQAEATQPTTLTAG